MSPLIRPHDHVLIERVHPDQVRFGDVIMFASAEERVIHRVVGKKRCLGELTFLEKGDLNPSIGLVPAHHVLGRVSLVRRGGCSLDLLSGRGRAVQIALAVCSMAPLVTKESVKQVLGRLGLPCRGHGLGRLLDRAMTVLPRILVKSLGSG
jgi:signal peptidase I